MLSLPLLEFVAYHRDTLPGLLAGPDAAAAARAVAGEPALVLRVDG
jgi:hypothetical protein